MSCELQSNQSIVKSHGICTIFHHRQAFTMDKSETVKSLLGGPENFHYWQVFIIDKFHESQVWLQWTGHVDGNWWIIEWIITVTNHQIPLKTWMEEKMLVHPESESRKSSPGISWQIQHTHYSGIGHICRIKTLISIAQIFNNRWQIYHVDDK